jgi:hypothetical protein
MIGWARMDGEIDWRNGNGPWSSRGDTWAGSDCGYGYFYIGY